MTTARLTKMIFMWKRCTSTKLRILTAVIFPTVICGYEAWTVNKTENKKFSAFEMK